MGEFYSMQSKNFSKAGKYLWKKDIGEVEKLQENNMNFKKLSVISQEIQL